MSITDAQLHRYARHVILDEVGEVAAPDAEAVTAGDLRLDLVRREATRNEEKLPLKPKEFDLLGFFMRNPGRAFTRASQSATRGRAVFASSGVIARCSRRST